MKPLLLTIVMGVLTACASKSFKNPGQTREFVFPYGSYSHEVQVELVNRVKDHPGKFDFSGAVEISATSIKLVGLSPVGTTLFRITETRVSDRTPGKVEIEIYAESLKKAEPQMRDYYAIVRELLITKTKNGKIPELVKIKDATVRFSDYDEHQIPTHISVDSEKFKIVIKVTGYGI